MKRRVKIFEAGKYKQGDFGLDRVKKIFGDVQGKISGAYIHTKTAKDAGIKPVPIGKFSEISVDNSGIVMADCEFNEKGESYYADGIMKGISVEIDKSDNLAQIAILPPGVNPAISGAEFSEIEGEFLEVVEFEEGGNMTLEEIKTALAEMTLEDRLAMIKVIGQSITPDEKQAFRAVQYEFAEIVGVTVEEFATEKGVDIEVKEKEKVETEEEIEARIEAKYKAKSAAETEFAEFQEILKKNVLPAHQEIAELAFKAAQGKDDIIEFSETEKCTEKDHLIAKVKAMNELEGLTLEFAAGQGEKEETAGDKNLRIIKEKADSANQMYGGKK
jgi:hypothetical protein